MDRDMLGLALLIAIGVSVVVLSNKRKVVPQQASPVQQGASNAETWEWNDWQGNARKITVHRDVKFW